jgi:hypothetical protein
MYELPARTFKWRRISDDKWMFLQVVDHLESRSAQLNDKRSEERPIPKIGLSFVLRSAPHRGRNGNRLARYQRSHGDVRPGKRVEVQENLLRVLDLR